MGDKPTPSPPLYTDDLEEQSGDGPATRALIEARNRRLAAQADTPAQGNNTKRERSRNPWLDI